MRELTDHPNRLVQPMRRRGERGAGEWEEIDWDTALEIVVDRLLEGPRGPRPFVADRRRVVGLFQPGARWSRC